MNETHETHSLALTLRDQPSNNGFVHLHLQSMVFSTTKATVDMKSERLEAQTSLYKSSLLASPGEKGWTLTRFPGFKAEPLQSWT